VLQDVRYSVRVLIKNPGFTAVAVLSLALGIGANAAIFSLLDAVLLKTLPVRQPEQLVFLETGEPSVKRSTNISYRTYERLRGENQLLADACYFGFATRINASFNGSPEVIEGQLVSGSFFSTLGVDAAVGRTFTDADDSETGSQQVAVIPSSWRETTFQVRTAGDPLAVVAAIRREVQALEPNLPVFRVKTLEQQVDETLGQERLIATLSSLFGVLALLLACAGLYGVLSNSVSRRTREIGVRMALGAKRGDVLRFFIRQGMTLVFLGLVFGLAVAFALTRFVSSLLFGVSATDFVTFVVVALGLVVVGLLACYIPARRATKVDPLIALRSE
jgi:hypothetical protein